MNLCGGCKHFSRTHLECRRFPPTLLIKEKEKFSRGYSYISKFTRVTKLSYACGEFIDKNIVKTKDK